MSELNEQRWALISERGIEVNFVTYSHALTIQRSVRVPSTKHAYIVTSEAARRDAEGRRRKG